MLAPRRLACTAAVCWLSAGAVLGAPLVVEETFLTVDIGGEPFTLEALVSKELGKGPRLPIAVITHGQSRDIGQKVTARAYMRTARESTVEGGEPEMKTEGFD